MYKSASRALRNVFYIDKLPITVHTFLAPGIVDLPGPCIVLAPRRRYHSVDLASSDLASDRQNHDDSVAHIQVLQDSPHDAAGQDVFRKRDSPEAWLALLDTYLPSELRSKSSLASQKLSGIPTAKPIHTLPFLLSESRKTTPLKLDLLSYLGTHEGRWDGVVWLVKELLKRSESDRDRIRQGRPSTWETEMVRSQPLDIISQDPIRLEDQGVSHRSIESLDEMTGARLPSSLGQSRKGLGQVWASIASMILQATDVSPNDENHKTIMSHVLEILAHLHHIDALPNTIYNYSHAKDPSVIRKPPTLYLLAYRIMTVLSDSAWKAHDEEMRREAQMVGAKDWYKGHEVLGPTLQPRVNELGTEIWLDLVLWCCVEGGWITEAAWIVTEMAKRKGNLKWSVIDWNSIREPAEPKLNWSARVELEIARSRMNQIASGIGIAGQSGAPPFVEMGPRTISKEVILALMDALSNTITPLPACNSPTMVVRSLGACRTILGRSSLGLEEPLLNKIVLSIFESAMTNPRRTPGDLERILDMAPSYRAKTQRQGSTIDSSAQPYSGEFSAACIGLLHGTLYYFALQGNLQGALRSFHKLQSLVDSIRRRHIVEFAEDLKGREGRDDHDDELISESIKNLIPGVHPQIPVYVLASVLNLITHAGQHEFGEWLLYSNEVDGPLIPQSMYAEEALQPALLRFAEATADGDLFANISAKLKAPLPTEILRTLLHCQITLGKWDAAEEVFRHLQSHPQLGFTAEDIMSVARAILRLDAQVSKDVSEDLPTSSHSLSRARTLLQEILHGQYNRSRDPSEPKDYSEVRILTQIGRILRSVPGSLAQIPRHTFGGVGRANATIYISTEAFNMLLEGVVEAHGSFAGRKAWSLWCRPAGEGMEQIPDAQPEPDGRELVVAPSLQTLRIVMRPMVRAAEVRNQQEAELVSWAIDMCHGFGLTAKEIDYKLPGLIAKPKVAPEDVKEQREAA